MQTCSNDDEHKETLLTSVGNKEQKNRTLLDEAREQLNKLQNNRNKDCKQYDQVKQNESDRQSQSDNKQEAKQSRHNNKLVGLIQYQKLHDKLEHIQNAMDHLKKNIETKKQQQNKDTHNSHKQTELSILVTQEPEKSGLHYSTHNAQQDIYYISELLRAYQDERSLAREHLNSTLSILKRIDLNKKPTDKEMDKCGVNLPLRAGYQGKKTLVFDLDETLVHCNYSAAALCDIRLPIKTSSGEVEAGINVRPYARQMLSALSKHFEIIIFTASHSSYANVVIDYLDEKKEWVHHRLFRQHCQLTSQGLYVKDLRVIKRDLKNMILVDNAAYSFAYQLQNAVPILPYYQGQVDSELKKLKEYLMRLCEVEDMRQENCKTFKLHLYSGYYQQPQLLVQQLYMPK